MSIDIKKTIKNVYKQYTCTSLKCIYIFCCDLMKVNEDHLQTQMYKEHKVKKYNKF